MAGGYLNITPEIIKNIPIPLEYKNSKLIDIVNLIISNDSPSYYIEELNKVTFKLYNLTYEEVKIIDTDFSLSKQEYNEFEI